jgi:hypothetical protein
VSMVVLDMQVDKSETWAAFAAMRTVLSPAVLQEFLRARATPWITDRAAKRFVGQGDDAVGKWTPLRFATAEIRARMGFPPSYPINVRTGKLRSWVTSPSSQSIRSTGLGVELTFPGRGGNAELRKKLQTAQVGKRDTPRTVRRPVLALNQVDADALLLRFHSWFVAEMARGGDTPYATGTPRSDGGMDYRPLKSTFKGW